MSETIRRVASHTKGFTIMVNEALQRPDLSARAKGLYAYLMTLPDDWVIRKPELYSHFTEGREAMETAFKELSAAGYIASEEVRTGGRFSGYRHTIHESSTGPQETVHGKPEPGKPLTENPTLLSTDLPMTEKPSTSAVAYQPRFQKPTVDQVKAYCQERKNSINPEKWLAHYEANGWRVGKNPMKDWKAAVRTWEHSDFGAAPKPQQTDDSWRFKDPRAERLKEAANAR